MLGEHMNLRIWSQLKAAQGSKAIWMILGWKGFMEEMSWTLKHVQDCEMDGEGQLRQNSTAKATKQAGQFGWSRGHVQVLYKPKMVWTLSLSHRKYWKVRFKEGWNVVGKILNAKGRLLTLWLCQLLDVWPQAKLVSLCEHWLPHLWNVGVNNHLIELFWG